MLLAVLGGCMTSDKTAPGQPHQFGAVSRAREVPYAQGPFGQPVPVYNAAKDKAPGGDIILASAQAPSGGVQQAGFGAKADCADCDVKGIKGGHKLGHAGLGHGGYGLHGGAGGGVISHPKWDRMGAGLPAPPPGAVAAVGALPGARDEEAIGPGGEARPAEHGGSRQDDRPEETGTLAPDQELPVQRVGHDQRVPQSLARRARMRAAPALF